ncbi:BamA/TamA family outer membrane protein [Rhizosphaericola mali]|uniref:BamA/TamA family outer membrane protein n=1 Tax=Rhizosphaericola mali TaxID=2545455 RepID=A0A5P2FY21_9BACT|nr:BamA/TamA family outer membrane protein [Rhizosphaericola mali]QES87278.1 BamA/TamA family outer membrane protein [Rhizosphaericola mali]
MRRRFVFILLLNLFYTLVQGQEKAVLKSRVIFLGDAGEINKSQQSVIRSASQQIINNKTSVVFLGDNVYPDGMFTEDDRKYNVDTTILRSQFQQFRDQNVPVIFIPGNHDWDNSGPYGLQKTKNQWAFIQSKNDSLLKFLPENGCPDPVAIPINDSLVIISMDSEWWLFPFDKKNEDADCNCSTDRDVLNSLAELLYQNRNKTILFTTHHPFASYGNHGGFFSLKDYIFPLTELNSSLYLPLPIIGSLYPIIRKTFSSAEDLNNPRYEEMVQRISSIFMHFPNLIHISGHEHNLQLIDNKQTKHLQVISGSVAHNGYVKNGKDALFTSNKNGYVIIDYYANNDIQIKFYENINNNFVNNYSYHWNRYKNIQQLDDIAYEDLKGDSLTIAVHPAYNEVGKLHKFIYGKNYRKEWAAEVKLPILRISKIDGGLEPVKLGGGYQSTSLRLVNPEGKEFTLRSVEKSTDLIIPDAFRGTFVKNLLDDNTSSQHPYSALVVPPLAHAIGVPHSVPEIGVVAFDKNMGMYKRLFYNKVALLEDRDPLGKTDNYIKFMNNLQKDNDNSYDAPNFLKARMLDLLLADWDRHGDQWRFKNLNKKKENKYYIAIPRDRDMVFNKTNGVIPHMFKRNYLMPRVFGFGDNVMAGSNYYFYKSAFLNAHPASQIPYDVWMRLTREFKTEMTDSVLKKGLDQMPPVIEKMRYNELYTDLKDRRDGIEKAMDKYYKFSNYIVDLKLSDKNELVKLMNVDSVNAIHLIVQKISKHGKLEDTLVNKIYPKSITKELRIYLGKGDDSVLIDNHSSVRVRIIGGKGDKIYHVENSKKRIRIYDRKEEFYSGDTKKLSYHISKDSANLSFIPTNLYNTIVPNLTFAYNPDDGIFLGAASTITRQRGFRKSPYTSLQQITATHAFNTNAFNLKYYGEWLDVFGKTDFVLNTIIKAPNNTQNFFGVGNETVYDKDIPNFRRYYRSRFTIIDINPSLRWNGKKKNYFSAGLSYQYYHLGVDENTGRFILNTGELNSNDSASIRNDKSYLGIRMSYVSDRRNNAILPTYGSYFYISTDAQTGLNTYSKSYIQIKPQFSFYRNLNNKRSLVFADRIGGGVTLGNAPFYESMFLGGQGNLLGYRQYRFAGQHAFYNNLELRWAMADFGNYVLKGELGLTGFYDVGRVWVDHEYSNKWHNAIGGGVYFAPAKLAVFRLTIGKTTEGWYPVFGMGMRF